MRSSFSYFVLALQLSSFLFRFSYSCSQCQYVRAQSVENIWTEGNGPQMICVVQKRRVCKQIRKRISNVRFEVLTAGLLTVQVFWDIRPCRLVNRMKVPHLKSSSSSSICHGVGPLVDPFRSHVSRSLFKGLP
jgi:hypothetical protein